jgi:hypothetical protein
MHLADACRIILVGVVGHKDQSGVGLRVFCHAVGGWAREKQKDGRAGIAESKPNLNWQGAAEARVILTRVSFRIGNEVARIPLGSEQGSRLVGDP